MAPKLTRAVAKAKELQAEETPLVQILKNIKTAKVQEAPFPKLWEEIQEWAYEYNKMTHVAEKIRKSTILQYPNAPLMESFGGTKEAAVKFIISRYHNDRFYFDQLIDITGDVISKLSASKKVWSRNLWAHPLGKTRRD